jgi:CCR4-NOT transcription complex subunit 3
MRFLRLQQLIESKMEQFKICEKDTKTKAYSKEGLARQANLDPKEAEREEKRSWLNDCLERLGDLVDSIEADIEKVSNVRGKAKNKEQVCQHCTDWSRHLSRS